MSFLRPSALHQFLITSPSLRWMPCQSWGFLRWPGLDGFLRLLVVVLLWSTFSEIRHIPSSSMYPTLRVGDRIIVEKAPRKYWQWLEAKGLENFSDIPSHIKFVLMATYYVRSPAIRDIVTFRDPTQHSGEEQGVFIKRIVAKAGDLVQVNHGWLYVNGIAQREDFISGRPTYKSNLTCVPQGHVYVLGDNRNNSYDSHVWGPLPMKNILGRYVMCFCRPSNN